MLERRRKGKREERDIYMDSRVLRDGQEVLLWVFKQDKVRAGGFL